MFLLSCEKLIVFNKKRENKKKKCFFMILPPRVSCSFLCIINNVNYFKVQLGMLKREDIEC